MTQDSKDKYVALLEHLDAFHEAQKLGRMYAVIDAQGVMRCASKEFCSAIGVDHHNSAKPFRSFLSTDMYEDGLRHVAFWAHYAKSAKPDDVSKECARVEKEYARMIDTFDLDAHLDQLDRITKRFETGKHDARTFACKLRFTGTKKPVTMNVNATLVRDAERGVAGTILSFAPYNDKVPWYRRVWNRFMEFEPYVVTDEEIVVVNSLENITDVQAYYGRMFGHINAQILARQLKTPQRKLVVNLREVPDSVKPDYVKLMLHFIDKHSVNDVILGNPSSAVYSMIKKHVSPVPAAHSLLYRYPGQYSISELEQFIEGTITELKAKNHDANPVSNESVQPDVKDSEGKSLDVLVDSKSAEKPS